MGLVMIRIFLQSPLLLFSKHSLFPLLQYFMLPGVPTIDVVVSLAVVGILVPNQSFLFISLCNL